jgi:TldD protein
MDALTDWPLSRLLPGLTGAALDRAGAHGCEHASVRVHETRTARTLLRDDHVGGGDDVTRTGLAVRVHTGGGWGFAATTDLTPGSAAAAADRAVALAATSARFGRQPPPVPEPVYAGARWASPYEIDPFDLAEADRIAPIAGWSARLRDTAEVDHVLAKLVVTRERTHYADLAGTDVTQQRLRIHPELFALGSGETLRTQGPPTARGWEYLEGTGWDWDGEIACLPAQLAAKARAKPVTPGRYDIVVDPSHLWLTLHESVGHATERDRALGHEASYAGTTFLTPDDVGSLRYGSPLMTVTADRTLPHGLATTGYDDEGVAAQRWPLVEDGVLACLQDDRRTAAGRSTGCATAESGVHEPLPRLPNVSLEPAAEGPGLDGLIAGVDDGIYLAGAAGWSIDMRRDHFQFTPQQAFRIRGGHRAEPLSDVAYQGRTTEFWGSLAALGGPRAFGVFGADLCGKGLPVQAAACSHGCPPAVFSGVRVISTAGAGS